MEDHKHTITRDLGAHAAAHSGGHAPDHAPEQADEWHHHSAQEGEPQGEHTAQVNPLHLVKWLIGIIIAIVVVVYGLAKLTEMKVTQLRAERVEVDVASDYLTKRSQVEAELGLTGPRQFVPLSGTAVKIPIDDAMGKIVGSYQSGTRSLKESLPPTHSPLK
jgi:hypothetical protein